MDPKEMWMNFVKTGRIEYYLEYKNSQKIREKEDADNNRCTGYKS